MKCSLQLLIAALATASPLIFERDLASVTKVVQSVGSKIDALDTVIRNFAGDTAGVVTASEALVSTVMSGISEVEKSEELPLNDAVKLIGPVADLEKHGQKLRDDLKSQRKQIRKLKKCEETRQQIRNISFAAQQLTKALTSKVPARARPIAESKAKGFLDILATAKKDFDEDDCSDTKPDDD
ncbi:hypothetical protein XA68_12451 [Ophiocordyceps unilateralis]|uniref:Cell wall protein n=1 Tax=Ophiocordyceps unilateralis TaxID=268505 RepID=A0A2A9PEQ5_OPHUN|nr:hypothetical protein XA68_12451 [Ophiocordyceps unilateralis]